MVEEKILVNASAEKIFAIYADVANWHIWDPDTKLASIQGSFQTGSKGKLTPTKGQEIGIVFTQVESNRL